MAETLDRQLLKRSSGYLKAARILECKKHGDTSLTAPISFLLAHGLEVLFKSALFQIGCNEAELKDFGHDIDRLWKSDQLEPFREAQYQRARLRWMAADVNKSYVPSLERDASKPWKDVIDKNISVLSRLHSKGSNYALRYSIDPGELVPIPTFLLEVFLEASDEMAKRTFVEGDKENGCGTE